MIATGRKEESAGIVPHHLVESKRVVVEGSRCIDVSNVEVNVTDPRSRRHSSPRLAAGGGDETLNVERIRRHRELPVLVTPRAARAIRVSTSRSSVSE